MAPLSVHFGFGRECGLRRQSRRHAGATPRLGAGTGTCWRLDGGVGRSSSSDGGTCAAAAPPRHGGPELVDSAAVAQFTEATRAHPAAWVCPRKLPKLLGLGRERRHRATTLDLLALRRMLSATLPIVPHQPLGHSGPRLLPRVPSQENTLSRLARPPGAGVVRGTLGAAWEAGTTSAWTPQSCSTETTAHLIRKIDLSRHTYPNKATFLAAPLGAA